MGKPSRSRIVSTRICAVCGGDVRTTDEATLKKHAGALHGRHCAGSGARVSGLPYGSVGPQLEPDESGFALHFERECTGCGARTALHSVSCERFPHADPFTGVRCELSGWVQAEDVPYNPHARKAHCGRCGQDIAVQARRNVFQPHSDPGTGDHCDGSGRGTPRIPKIGGVEFREVTGRAPGQNNDAVPISRPTSSSVRTVRGGLPGSSRRH